MAITHISVFSVPVSDQERAKRFYTETLGFDLVSDTEMGALRWIQVAPTPAPGKAGQAALTLVNWFESMAAGSLRGLVFETEDVDAEVARLAERGVAFAEGIQEAPWGRYATFEDPDGNGLIVQTSRA